MITDKEIEKIFEWAYKNNISGLPKNKKDLSKTNRLVLSTNIKSKKNYSLPKELFNLIDLEDLELFNLNIRELSNEILNLKNLRLLRLQNSSIKTLPELWKLDKLYYLNLNGLKITEVPKDFRYFKSLEILKIINCKNLSIIPKEIVEIKKLRHLEIKGNSKNLKYIPKEVWEFLMKIEVCYISHYNFKEIPNSLGDYVNLKYIYNEWSKWNKNKDFFEIVSNKDFENLAEIKKFSELFKQDLNIGYRLGDTPYIKITKSEKLKLIPDTKDEYNLDFPHKNLLLKGVTGTGKSYTIDKIIRDELKLTTEHRDNILKINIHSASSNADLMQGIGISFKDGQIEYREKQGLIYNHIKKALFKPHQPFVLVLEEIQENSLNELIGDLIYLIEPKKRARVGNTLFKDNREYSYEELIDEVLEINEHYVEIPYLVDTSTKYRKMVLPDNLYIFCTSNYRDDKKVIEDNLLRRFDVVEVYPKTQEELGEDIFKSKDISDFLEKLNDTILEKFKFETHPDRYLIGHANWLDITKEDTKDNKRLFYTALLKVIIEFKEIREVEFDSYTKEILQSVLEDGELSDRVKRYIKECNFKYISYKEMIEKLQKKIYNFV